MLIGREIHLDPKKEEKILNKIYSIGLTKIAIDKEPLISIPEFKSILSEQQIPRECWFRLAKDFHHKGYVKLRATRCLFVLLSLQSLVGVYNYKSSLRHIFRKQTSLLGRQHQR